MFPVFLLYINDYKKESSEYEFNIFIALVLFFICFIFYLRANLYIFTWTGHLAGMTADTFP